MKERKNYEALKLPFDPVERSQEVEKEVMRGEKRSYYRFRPAPYYGGIATADAVGCSFLCAYCWNYSRNLSPKRFVNFYSPLEVATNLIQIAEKKFLRLFRISGAEPILGENSFQHFLDVIHFVSAKFPRSLFILETNGLFLGYKSTLIRKLKLKNLRIRVCLKGIDEESFQLVTGAKKEFFRYPLLALAELEKEGITTWPAIMEDIFSEKEIASLKMKLSYYGIRANLESETLEAYPFVLENMRKRRVRLKKPG